MERLDGKNANPLAAWLPLSELKDRMEAEEPNFGGGI